MKQIIVLAIIISPITSFAQLSATTDSGDKVVLYNDGTWKYKDSADFKTPGPAVYKGTPGGSNRSGLDLYGWQWDNIPRPNISEGETGKIVFNIEVDENGELIRYTKQSGTMSASAERACVAAIQKLTFTKKKDVRVPAVSKGTITFIIQP
jgi:hypothetical protein